jgi:transcriptional regulator with XRE-family HTH domain
MELVSNFTDRLREAVHECNLTQSEIADNAHISRSLFSKYMAGKSKAGNVNLYNLAQVLRVDVRWLMGFNVPKRADEEHKQLRIEINEKLETLSTEKLQKVKRFIEDFLD